MQFKTKHTLQTYGKEKGKGVGKGKEKGDNNMELQLPPIRDNNMLDLCSFLNNKFGP